MFELHYSAQVFNFHYPAFDISEIAVTISRMYSQYLSLVSTSNSKLINFVFKIAFLHFYCCISTIQISLSTYSIFPKTALLIITLGLDLEQSNEFSKSNV